MTSIHQFGDCVAFSVIVAILTVAYIRAKLPEEKPKKQTYQYVAGYRRKKA